MAEAGTLVQDYNYGPNGNRTALTTSSGTTTGTYDAQDRLSTYGDFTYTYGGNGELASRTDTTNGDVTDYVYDARGSLLNVSLPDTTQLDYVIDGQARRVAKKVNGVTTQAFLYKDGLRIIAELDAAGEIVSRFNYVGGSHSPDTMTTGGETYRFVKDQVGSPRLVVNVADGSVAQRLDYDAFGVVTFDTNPGFQPFGFAGGLYDADTGLVRFGARDYYAATGRWTAKDPIRWGGGQENFYLYVKGDPVNRIDPSGLVPSVSCRRRIVQGCDEGSQGICGPLAFAACVAIALVDEAFGSGGYCDGGDEGGDGDGGDDDCAAEWAAANQKCAGWLTGRGRRTRSNRGLRGGYTNLYDCARGHVSQPQGGNRY